MRDFGVMDLMCQSLLLVFAGTWLLLAKRFEQVSPIILQTDLRNYKFSATKCAGSKSFRLDAAGERVG
jgi:hypothetical protein